MRHDAKDLAKDTDPLLLRLAGMLRRMAVTVTAKALWQVAGFRMPDGKTETRSAEAFTGMGFYARPPSSGKPEAVVGFVGGDRNPIVIATRDEATRAVMAGGLQADETMIFTSKACVYVKADETIEIRSKNGIPVSLATNPEFAAIVNILATWAVVPNDGGAALKAAINAYLGAHAGFPKGTQKLKGE